MQEYAALVKLRHKGANGRYRNIEEGEIFSDISPEDAEALINAGTATAIGAPEAAFKPGALPNESSVSPDEAAAIAAEITGNPAPTKRGRGKK